MKYSPENTFLGGAMLETIQRYRCRDCQSLNIVKNGHNRSGSRQYLCKDCGCSKTLVPQQRGYSPEKKEEVLRAYQESSSIRGVCRTFKISRSTVTDWLKKSS